MRDVFISHVEEDQAVALQIAAGLRAAGYTTWCYEEDSLPGPAYLVQTGEAIDGCRAVVLIISPDALSSNQVTVEVVRAHESGKPFFPILRGITHPEFQARQPLWRQALGAAAAITLPAEGVDAILPRLVAGLKALQVEPGEAPPRDGMAPRPEPPKGPTRKLQPGRWLWAVGGSLALIAVAFLAVRLVGPLAQRAPTQPGPATSAPAQAGTGPTVAVLATAAPATPAPGQPATPPATAASPLQPLAVFQGTLKGAGDTKYHQVTVAAGQHLFAVLDAADNRYANALYIRFGSLPSPEQYDDMGDLPGADQAVEVANTQASTYNLMVQAKEYSSDYTLTVYSERSFPSLTMGAAAAGNLAGAGDLRFHQVNTQAGEHLTVLLDAADNRYANELYIRFGSLPTTEQYDAKGALPGADQAVDIAGTQAGTYYVMVRSREYASGYTVAAYNDGTFPSLTLGTPLTGRLVGRGDVKFHQVRTQAGQHLIVLLDAADDRYANELYIRFGSLPTPEQSDDKGDVRGADQAVEIASTQAGVYYIMVYSREYETDYTLTAQ